MDLPIVIEIVDTEQKIREFLAAMEATTGAGLIKLEKVPSDLLQDKITERARSITEPTATWPVRAQKFPDAVTGTV